MKVWKRFAQGWTRWAQALVLLAGVLSAATAYSASKTILVVGDSLSAEYGLVRGTGWVPLLEKRLRRENIDATVVNASISGDTTSGGKTRLPGLLDRHHPNVVILELGGNDALRGLQLTATETNLRDMITSSQKQKAKVLLVGMRIPPNYGPDYANRFAAIYPKLAKQTKSALVPFLLEGIAERQELFQADRIHPTVEAQATMLDTIWPHLKPLLKK
jgi:acyl-CoA thioesterase-1